MRRAWLPVLAALVLCGCAGQQAYREGRELIALGQYAEGMKKIDEAVAADPRNVEFRVYQANQKLATVNGLLARAESARGLGRAEEAEALYNEVLAIEPRNIMAGAGIKALAAEKRHQKIVEQADARFKKGEVKEAEAAVRAVLAENPNHRDANALRTRIAEKRVQERRGETKLSDAFRKPVTLEFRDAQLRSVFDVLARASSINFIFDKDVKADTKVNINARNTTVDDALKLLLLTNQLEQRVLNENTVLIYPNTVQKAKDYQSLTVRSFYLANADVKHVSNTLKTILKTRDIVVNEKLNLIIIRDTPEAITLAERLIALEDIGESELMLEVEVMEIKRSRLQELGLRWPDQYQISVQQAAGVPFTLFDLRNFSGARRDQILGSIDIRAQSSSNYLLNLKRDDGDTNLLANPRIRVRNKEKAKILIGDRVPVITTTSTSTGFVADSVNYVDVGLKLEVEPNIYLDDEVAIKVALEVSSIAREITTRSGTLSYQIGTRTASTVLKLRDGETQVLAGLINDEDRTSANRVPGIGQFPIIGRLFSNQRDDSQKTEIVLSITPRLIRTVRRPDLVVAEFDSGTESSLGGRSLAIGASAVSDGRATPVAGPTADRPFAPPPPPSPDARPPGPTSALTPQPLPSSISPSQPPPGTSPSGLPQPPVATFAAFWNGQTQARVGDTFALALQVQTQDAITALPILISFDPSVFQPIAVTEGDFLKRDGAQSEFTTQIDSQSGRIQTTGVRIGEAGAVGSGTALVVSFRALRPAAGARIDLLAITPNPPPSQAPTTPMTHRVDIGG